jgi:4-amino-4-deoxy-L-arabinose transferase-like glycosyltransferase
MVMMSYLRRLRANQFEIQPAHWLLFFSLLGFGLRLQQLSLQPLWGDEGWSFYLAAQPLPQLLAFTAIDIHPPFYYLVLKGWLALAGSGAEAARFLSVAIGTMLIPVLGVLGRRLFEQRTGVVAAAVVALMPLAIYYSQEVRMYGLVTLLGAISVYALLRLVNNSGHDTTARRPTNDKRQWLIVYIIATAAALYTHYYAVFIPIFQLIYVLLGYARRQRRSRYRANFLLLTPFVYVGLLYLPWAIYVGTRLISYVANKRVADNDLPLSFMSFFGDHFVAFSLGHLPDRLQPYLGLTLLFAIVALIGWLVALFYHRLRQASLYLALYLLLPMFAGYIINRVYPFNPPYFERTLLLVAPAYWLLIAAGLVWLWQRQAYLTGILSVALLMIITVSLFSFYTLPRYPEEDYRPLLKDIAARATLDDTLLASYQWQLGFYQAYLPPPRPHLFAVPGWGRAWAGEAGRARLTQDLSNILARSPRLWFPAYQAQGHIWEDEAEAAIAELGYPARLDWLSPQTKLTLAGSAPETFAQAPTANFENKLLLQQAGIGSQPYQAGRDIVPIELNWYKQGSLGREHRISLRLADAAGRTWATRDSYPRAGQRFFTDMAIGDTLLDRHGLLIPAGTPPGSYRLLLSVRNVDDARPLDLVDAQGQPLGAELLLGQIEVIVPDPPVGAEALPVQFKTQAVFERQVRLVGYSLGEGPFKSGETLPLTLFWKSLGDSPGPLTVSIRLQDETGQPVVQHEQAPIWPATEWQRGTILRDPHDIALPPTLTPGEYELVVALITPEGTRLTVAGDDHLRLTGVHIIDRLHNFEAPEPQLSLSAIFGDQAKLIGLDLPQTRVQAGDTLPLTLYWQALAPFDKSWTVFVHLLDEDNHIVGQQDQIPGSGQFPTTGWLPNEYLIDPYNLSIPADTPPGDDAYRLEIGLYDANDFTRLPVIEDGESTNNYIILERWPISIE